MAPSLSKHALAPSPVGPALRRTQCSAPHMGPERRNVVLLPRDGNRPSHRLLSVTVSRALAGLLTLHTVPQFTICDCNTYVSLISFSSRI